jgi:hypothetical protein
VALEEEEQEGIFPKDLAVTPLITVFFPTLTSLSPPLPPYGKQNAGLHCRFPASGNQ